VPELRSALKGELVVHRIVTPLCIDLCLDPTDGYGQSVNTEYETDPTDGYGQSINTEYEITVT